MRALRDVLAGSGGGDLPTAIIVREADESPSAAFSSARDKIGGHAPSSTMWELLRRLNRTDAGQPIDVSEAFDHSVARTWLRAEDHGTARFRDSVRERTGNSASTQVTEGMTYGWFAEMVTSIRLAGDANAPQGMRQAARTDATLGAMPLPLVSRVTSGARSLDDLSRAAGALDRGGLSAAGRALQKHGSRSGSVFPAAQGNPAAINRQGQNVVDDILTAPGNTTVTRHHARFGNVTEVRAPDGRGVRYGDRGEFLGFLEPRL